MDGVTIITSHDLGVPPEVAAVFRALATIEGTITRISPGFDLVAASRQFAAAHVTDRLAPDVLRRTATEELATLLPMLRRLPSRGGSTGSRPRRRAAGSA